MAYQAKRKRLYEEEFQLTEEDGTVVHTLHVALDADSMVKKLSEKRIDLVRALQDVRGISADSNEKEFTEGLEKLGNAVVDMFEAVFGKEDAETIVEFYDNRYIEMCNEVVPFITDVVIPKVRKIAQANKKATLSQYNRKQRRVLQFGKK